MRKWLFFLFLPLALLAEKPIVYLQLEGDLSSQLIVHWITSKKEEKVSYHPLDSSKTFIREGEGAPISSELMVYSIHLQELTPDTDYLFTIGDDLTPYHFRTAPRILTAPLRFVTGGDLYEKEIESVEKGLETAAKQDPLFALVGGDLAYAGNKSAREKEKLERWLLFLKTWQEKMVTAEGRMIPMAPVTSNEDINGRFGCPASCSPLFFSLFTMPSYYVLQAGSYMTIVCLDSGHTSSISGAQTAWLSRVLEKTAAPHLFALYHVPAFPCYRPASNLYCSLVRRYWVPLFERAHLSAAFEHHDHAYKRSILIHGVLYLGDGGWGVSHPRKAVRPNQRWYLEQTAVRPHFLLVTLSPDGTESFQAFDAKTGEVFDTFSRLSPRKEILLAQPAAHR